MNKIQSLVIETPEPDANPADRAAGSDVEKPTKSQIGCLFYGGGVLASLFIIAGTAHDVARNPNWNWIPSWLTFGVAWILLISILAVSFYGMRDLKLQPPPDDNRAANIAAVIAALFWVGLLVVMGFVMYT